MSDPISNLDPLTDFRPVNLALPELNTLLPTGGLWQQARAEAEAAQAMLPAAADKALDYFEIDKQSVSEGDVNVRGLVEQAVQEAGEFAAGKLSPHASDDAVPPPVPKHPAQWHYVVGEESRGPVSEEEFLALFADGTLSPSSLVWHKGMKEWLPAQQTELAARLKTKLPPLPASCAACGHSLKPDDRFCPNCGRPANP